MPSCCHSYLLLITFDIIRGLLIFMLHDLRCAVCKAAADRDEVVMDWN
jgi:hypothetical protein